MSPNNRYFVPDLSPMDRSSLHKVHPCIIFIAESPHLNEIGPDECEQRRPLCGVAGKQWWGLLSELLEGEANSDVSLKRLVEFCERHKIAVMNAVQYPLDPKIARSFPEAEPVKNLGFCKLSGPQGYKKMKTSREVQESIQSLRNRLCDPGVEGAEVHCLGNDAEWFVYQALGPKEFEERVKEKIPHPSAWWRQNGLFGQIAREKLSQIFTRLQPGLTTRLSDSKGSSIRFKRS
jgi:hypothetical protein